MLCPVCEKSESKVVDSREVDDGRAIRRRRECLSCQARFSTHEKLELLDLKVIKRDNRIQPYNLEKIERGIKLALKKRPFANGEVKQILNNIEREIIRDAVDCKIRSDEIGNIVLRELKKWDEVGYIRFASVYRSFDTIDMFAQEIKNFQ